MLDFYITITGPDPGPQLQQIIERLNIMPTQAELNEELAGLEQDLSTEIGEIAAALEAAGNVPQATVDRVRALRTAVTGIVQVGSTTPTEPGTPPA